MRVLMLDNRDSFTFNLVQGLRELGAHVVALRSDRIDAAGALALAPTHLVVSPGPGTPERAGNSLAVIRALLGRVPILGVCLGHQALALALGGRVERAAAPVHGKASPIFHDGRGLFRGLPNPFAAGRYHSLTVAADSVAPPAKVSAHGPAGEVFGLRAEALGAEGVQFHPESVLTPEGPRLLRNFLAMRLVRPRTAEALLGKGSTAEVLR